jgi:hypothetical protein
MFDWMPDLTPYMSVITIGALVIAGLLLCLLLYKLLRPAVRGRKGSRIGISEYYEVDKTRRLVLVRRDDVEHLIMIGGDQDLVVESGIGSPLMQPQTTSQHMQQPLEPSFQPQMQSHSPGFRQPRPPVFASRRPELRSVPNDDNVS